LSEINEMLNIKVDRFELNKLFELKTNKDDFLILMELINKLHTHSKQQSGINLSTIKYISL